MYVASRKNEGTELFSQILTDNIQVQLKTIIMLITMVRSYFCNLRMQNHCMCNMIKSDSVTVDFHLLNLHTDSSKLSDQGPFFITLFVGILALTARKNTDRVSFCAHFAFYC